MTKALSGFTTKRLHHIGWKQIKLKIEYSPQEQVQLVLLDNGHSRIYADQQLQQTLRCIRCGARLNHCPVYRRIGGHAYGTTYPRVGLLTTSCSATNSSPGKLSPYFKAKLS